MSNLLIRADATTEMGTGHIMRCLALAQGWQAEGNQAIFLSHCESRALRRRVEATGVNFISLDKVHPSPRDLQETLALVNQLQAEWLVVDGYHFDPDYHHAVQKTGCRLLVIDDTAHLPEYHADILLNQNINAEHLTYVCDRNTKMLLGAQYTLLRAEFLAWRDRRREIPRVARKLLVTLGGSDSDNVTLKVIQALQHTDISGLETRIIGGSANPHLEMLNHTVQRSDGNFQLLTDVSDMPMQMAWADMAVTAGGTTCGELAFMGVPSVLLVLAENQRANAEALGGNGAAMNLGGQGNVAPEQISRAVTQLADSLEMRSAMARRGQELVDGYGIERALMCLHGEKVWLRRVHEKDSRLIWEWANAPDTRAVSFSPEPISWERHLQWFSLKLNDPDCFFSIAVNGEGVPIGQVRYDVSGCEATVSISIGANFRGRGYGRAILMSASRQLYRVSRVKIIHAYIKMDNETSMRTFAKCGFRQTGTATVQGLPSAHLVLPKEATA